MHCCVVCCLALVLVNMLSFLSVFSFLLVRQLQRSGEGDEDKGEERERKKKDEQCEEEEVTVTSAHTEER